MIRNLNALDLVRSRPPAGIGGGHLLVVPQHEAQAVIYVDLGLEAQHFLGQLGFGHQARHASALSRIVQGQNPSAEKTFYLLQ